MSKFTLTLCAIAACVSAPAAAELPVVEPGKAVQAARDCASAAGPEGVVLDALVERGWALAAIESKGQKVDTPLRILGKDEGAPLIMTTASAGPAEKGCMVTGALKKRKAFDDLEDAFTEAFGVAGAKGGDSYFRIGKDIAILSQTGSRRKPSFRVAVMELGEKN